MRRFAFFLLAACRSQSAETQAPQPLPQATVQATTTTTTTVPPPPPPRICEPTVTCGMWSRCEWLELDHAESGYDVFRVAGSDAGGYGSHFWRVHHCWPEDAGPKGCALYCDAKGACVDGFTADAVCTASAAPRPSPWVCEVRGADCVSIAKGP